MPKGWASTFQKVALSPLTQNYSSSDCLTSFIHPAILSMKSLLQIRLDQWISLTPLSGDKHGSYQKEAYKQPSYKNPKYVDFKSQELKDMCS